MVFASPTGSSSSYGTPGTPSSVKSLDLLPLGYEPSNWDVICQRGKTCDDHIGNRRFRLTVENHVPQYLKANNRQAKSDVISSVVRAIRRATGRKGGFVMKVRVVVYWCVAIAFLVTFKTLTLDSSFITGPQDHMVPALGLGVL